MAGEMDQIGAMFSKMITSVSGGFTDLVAKLKDGGLADEVKSWVGKGENKPVTPEQVTEALGNEKVAEMAEQAGVTPEVAARQVAATLPGMVDKMTPDGVIPDAAGAKAAMASMASKIPGKPGGGMPAS